MLPKMYNISPQLLHSFNNSKISTAISDLKNVSRNKKESILNTQNFIKRNNNATFFNSHSTTSRSSQITQQLNAKKIVESCNKLEQISKQKENLSLRQLNKEFILGDMRQEKLNKMFDVIRGFQGAQDPETLGDMFIY